MSEMGLVVSTCKHDIDKSTSQPPPAPPGPPPPLNPEPTTTPADASKTGPLRVDRLVRAVNNNNESVVRNSIRIAELLGVKVGDLHCHIDFIGYGNIQAKGLTVSEFANKLISCGHDRHAIAKLLVSGSTSIRDHLQTNNDAKTTPLLRPRHMQHSQMGILMRGDKALHEELGLLTVVGIGAPSENDVMVHCKRFNRNNKQVTVPLESLSSIPEVSPMVWRYAVHVGAYTESPLKRFPLKVEALLENTWQTGPRANGDWFVTFHLAHEQIYQEGAATAKNKKHNRTVDFHTMMMVTDYGSKKMIFRDRAENFFLPLSLLELAKAVETGATVQIQGKGKGRVLFVNDESAKVEMEDAGKKKTFCSVSDIYSIQTDMAALDASRNYSLNFQNIKSVDLSDCATKAMEFPLESPSTEALDEYVTAKYEAQWQFRPGTEWSMFSTDNMPYLDGTFSSDCIDELDVDPCLWLTTYKYAKNGYPGAAGIRLTHKHITALPNSDPGFEVKLDSMLPNAFKGRYLDICRISVWTTDRDQGYALNSIAKSFAKQLSQAITVNRSEIEILTSDLDDKANVNMHLRIDPMVLEFCGTAEDQSLPNHEGYLLEIPTTETSPIIISGVTIEGIKVGIRSLLQSIGCVANSGETQYCVPCCFCMDVPTSGTNHRIAVGLTTHLQTSKQFVELATRSRSYQPSHSRYVRRAKKYLGHVDKSVAVIGHGLATLVSYNKLDNVASVQISHESRSSILVHSPELLHVPFTKIRIPPHVRESGLNWSSIKYGEFARAGRGEVLFLEFPDKRAVVVKRTEDPAVELAGYRIGHVLGVDLPHVIVLNAEHGEGRQLDAVLRMLACTGRLRAASKGGGGAGRRNGSFFVVQELQSGNTLRNQCHRGPKGWCSKSFGLDEVGARRLAQLGRMIAFDVLVHNADRWYLPGLFDSLSRCGNTANIMISPMGDAVAIDNICNAFSVDSSKGAAHFKTYLKAVYELGCTTRKRISRRGKRSDPAANLNQIEPHPALACIRHFFLHGQGTKDHAAYIPAMGHDIGNRGTEYVEDGFMEVLSILQDERFPDKLEKLENSIKAELCWQSNDVNVDFHHIRSSFFLAVADALLGNASALQ